MTTPQRAGDVLTTLQEMFAVCGNERRMTEAYALSAAIEALTASPPVAAVDDAVAVMPAIRFRHGDPMTGKLPPSPAAIAAQSAPVAAPGDGFPLYEFTTLLMCSDPWPVDDIGNGTGQEALVALADRESIRAGYLDWIAAYHALKSPKDNPAATAPPVAVDGEPVAVMARIQIGDVPSEMDCLNIPAVAVNGGFAVHAEVSRERGSGLTVLTGNDNFVVTHLPSGLIAAKAPSLETAVKAAQAMSELPVEWASLRKADVAAIPADVRMQIDVIRAAASADGDIYTDADFAEAINALPALPAAPASKGASK